MLAQRIIEVRDVGLVVLAVMDLHGLGVDVRLEGREIIGKLGQHVARFAGRLDGALLFYLCHSIQSFKRCLSNPALRGAVPPLFCCPDVPFLPHFRRRSWPSFCCAGFTIWAALRGSAFCITSTSCRGRSWRKRTLPQRAPSHRSCCRARSAGFAPARASRFSRVS